jgi:hypothetical protein
MSILAASHWKRSPLASLKDLARRAMRRASVMSVGSFPSTIYSRIGIL